MRTSNLAVDLGAGQGAQGSSRPLRGLREVPPPRPSYESRAEWREVLRDLGIEPVSLARNAISHWACTWVRGAIDVATGKVVLSERDFALGSAPTLAFDRVWVSSSTYAGPLGHGWHHAYDVALSCREDTVALRMPDGRVCWFTAPEASASAASREVFDSTEQLRLSRDAYGFKLRDEGGCELRFVPHRSQHAYVLSSMRAPQGCEVQLVRVGSRRSAFGAAHGPHGRESQCVSHGSQPGLFSLGVPRRLGAGFVSHGFPHGGAGRSLGPLCGFEAAFGSHHTQFGCGLSALSGVEALFGTPGSQHGFRSGAAGSLSVDSAFASPSHACVFGSMLPPYGCELRFAYDHRARLVRISGAGDCDLELRYDRADRIGSISAPATQRGAQRVVVAQYGYDARGNLTHAADALGQSRSYAYAKHLVTGWTDRSGSGTHFAWDGPDSRAQCVHVSNGPGGWSRSLEFEARATRVRDALGREVWFGHDGAMVSRIDDERGRVRDIVRGEGRRVERDVNALGRAVSCEYDASGRLMKHCGPDGATWTFERDARGRIVRAIDPFAGCWQLTYDSRGRVLSRTDPLGRVTRNQYRGRWLVAVSEPGDRRVSFAYDGAGRLESCTEQGGLAATCAYDAWGRLESIQAPPAPPQARQYDALGRLIRVCDGEFERELAYDAEGRLVRCTEPHRGDVRFTYQGAGLLSSRTEAGMTVCFDYDAEERLVGIVNEAGAVFRIARDASGEIIETTGFDGCTRRYARDALGRISRAERAGEFSEYEYDAGHRPIEVHDSDGAFEGFRYRADGALMCAWNQEHSVSFERDRCAQVMREICGDHFVASQFDTTGRRKEVLSSFGPHQVYERDAAGRLTRVVERTTGFEMRIEHDASGFAVRRAWGANRCVCEPDAVGRPSAMRYEDAAGKVMREFHYAWDGADRVTRVTDSASESVEYGYDARGDLTWRRTEHGIHQRRVLGPTGDLFLREDRRDREYGAAGQLLVRSVRSGEVTYRYDEAGRLIERREPSDGGACWSFAWSASGLLRSVRRPDGSEITFGYDALGRRVWKKYGGQTTRFVWDGTRLLHECVEGETPITWLNDPDEGHPIAKLSNGDVFTVVVDLGGAPIELRDARGDQVWGAELAFTGGLRSVCGALHACPLRGAGMYHDFETGLYCESRAGVPARYYDPVASVYLCQGALATAPSLRAYRYSFDYGVEWSEPRAEIAGIEFNPTREGPQARPRFAR